MEATKTYTVKQYSSVDISDVGTERGEFATRDEALEYIKANTVDGLNVSHEIECDYLQIAEDHDNEV